MWGGKQMASQLWTLRGFHLALRGGKRPLGWTTRPPGQGLPPLLPASPSPIATLQPRWPPALPPTQQASFSASPRPEKLFLRDLLSPPPTPVLRASRLPVFRSHLEVHLVRKSPFLLSETQHLLSLSFPSGCFLLLCKCHHLAFDLDFSCLPSPKCKHRDHY